MTLMRRAKGEVVEGIAMVSGSIAGGYLAQATKVLAADERLEVRRNSEWLDMPMEDFFRSQFMGPQLGTYYGYPVYAPDKDAMYQALTPEQFRAFSGNIHNVSRTWTQNVNLQVVNASLFELPAGDVGMAAVLQAGNQFWDNPIDPRVQGGEFFGQRRAVRVHERQLHDEPRPPQRMCMTSCMPGPWHLMMATPS